MLPWYISPYYLKTPWLCEKCYRIKLTSQRIIYKLQYILLFIMCDFIVWLQVIYYLFQLCSFTLQVLLYHVEIVCQYFIWSFLSEIIYKKERISYILSTFLLNSYYLIFCRSNHFCCFTDFRNFFFQRFLEFDLIWIAMY